jgi:transposase
MERSMSKPFDLSKSLTALDQDSTLIVVIEMSQSSWLVAARAPGLARDPLKKLPPDPEQLFKLIDRWREESRRAGRVVRRVCVVFEAGRDGFWLARLLRQHDIEAYVIHPTSIPVKRDHRRAKTDRLDTELLMRAFLGWLRGEADHCSMAAIPTLAEEDAKRPTRERESRVNARSRLVNRMKGALARLGIRGFNPKLRKAAEKLEELRTGAGEPLPPNTLAELRRDMAQLRFVADQIKQIEKAREARLEKAPREGAHPMVLMLASIKGVGLETAEMLVAEVLSRKLRDRRAVARYGGLTGSPDESGSKALPPPASPPSRARRERLAKSREGVGAVGQCARAARHDPTGLAVFDVPEGKRAGQMVRGAHRQWTARGAQDDDRRAGAQVVDRLVALRRGRDRAGRRRVVRLQGVSRNIEHRVSTETSASPALC